MARLSRLTRRLIGATGILLLLLSSSADALGLHRCAHHDALPSATQADAGHHGHDSAPADTDEQQHESCTCVGTCSVTTAAAAPRANAGVLEVAPVLRFSVSPSSEQPETDSAEHVLPWSTAPPAL